MKRNSGRDTSFKCTICGQWISYQDIMKDKVLQEFTPDTAFSTERCEMTHKKCINETKS